MVGGRDVLVIGGGLAGWRAAEAAVKAGCSVTLVANGDGNSPHIHALNCPVRPDDSVELFIEDTLRSGKGTNDRALVETLCRESVALKDEFPFDRDAEGAYKTIQPLGSSVPRCVSIDHAIGAVALAKLKRELTGKVKMIEGQVVRCRREGAPETFATRPRVADTSDAPETAFATRPRVADTSDAPETAFATRPRVADTSDAPETAFATRPRVASIRECLPRFPGLDRYAFSHVLVTHGERVDHWELPNCVYHICFRLADSVARQVAEGWRAEREELLARCHDVTCPMEPEEYAREALVLSEKVAKFLDAGHGECLLARNGVADVLLDVLRHDDAKQYGIHAVGIMPNHVHVLVQSLEGFSLQECVSQWKSVSAHRINRLLGRKGVVWCADHYNRIVRNHEEYRNQYDYVMGNDMVCNWDGRREGAPETFATRPRVADASDAPETFATRPRVADASDAPETFATRPRVADEENVFHSTLDSGKVLSSRAVVLATGGWCGKYDFSTNPNYLRGDGISLAESLGAAVCDMDAVQYEPTVRVEGPRRGVPVITTLLYKGARLLNDAGEEFLSDPHANKDELSRSILAEMNRTGIAGVWYDLTNVAVEDLLACKMDPSERRIRVAPAPHTSLGGVVIDTRCRVLRPDGTTIPGLFAAGEVTGGLHGLNRLGGNAGTEVLVFGRIAGASAAEFSKGN